MTLQVPTALRPMAADDVPLILSSWLKSGARSAMAKAIGRRTWYPEHERFLREQVLPRSTVTVACSPDDADIVYGWCCYDGAPDALALHYVYVKGHWRGLGVASHLIDSLGQIIYQTFEGERAPVYIYNPYPLFLGAAWQPLPASPSPIPSRTLSTGAATSSESS